MGKISPPQNSEKPPIAGEADFEAIRGGEAWAVERETNQPDVLTAVNTELVPHLNVLLGMLDLLADTKLSREQRQYLRNAQRSAELLRGGLNDAVDFGAIAKGELLLREAPISVHEIAEDVIEGLSPRAHARGISLVLDGDPTLPGHALGDGSRLRQVMVHLLERSVAVSGPGEVVLRLRWSLAESEPSAERAAMALEVGFLGNRDRQGEDDESLLEERVSDALVGLMKGEVQGAAGMASRTLRLRLPILRQEPAFSPFGDGRSVLVVDSSATSRRSLTRQLEAWGFSARGCDSPESALEAVLEGDVGIVTVNTAALRTSPEEFCGDLGARCQTPPWMLYLGAHPDAPLSAGVPSISPPREDAESSEVRELWLGRPPRLHQLRRALLRVLQPAVRATVAPTSMAPPEATGANRVLIVDDNPDNRKLLQRIVAAEGYEVELAADGQQALAKVARGRPYRAILMDIEMPRMDGFDCTAAVRSIEANRGHARTPIIALTAHALKGYRAQCVNAGMDDYLTKPVDRRVLRQTLRAWTEDSPGVLVIEGREDHRLLFDRMLRLSGICRAVYAADAKQAMFLLRNAERRAGALGAVLLSVDRASADDVQTQWPELLRRVRTMDVPLVLLGEPKPYPKLRAAAATTLRKPVGREELLQTLEDLLQRRPHMVPGQSLVPAEGTLPIEVEVAPELADIVPRFLEMRKAEVEGLDELLAGGEFADIRHIGHSIHQAGSDYGLSALAGLGRRIEQKAIEADGLGLEVLIDELRDYLARIVLRNAGVSGRTEPVAQAHLR